MSSEKKKLQDAQYYQDNKVIILARQIAYYDNNKEKVRKAQTTRLQTPIQRIKYLASRALSRAKKTGKEHDKEFLLSLSIHPPKHCKCCSKELDYSLGKGHNINAPTLDRLDSTKGYTKGNVEIICHECNTRKSNSTIAQLETIISFMKSVGAP